MRSTEQSCANASERQCLGRSQTVPTRSVVLCDENVAFRQDVRTASELALWVALGRGQAELLAMWHLQPLSRSPLTWTFSALGGTRTPNLLIRSQMLYPIELQAPGDALAVPVAPRDRSQW